MRDFPSSSLEISPAEDGRWDPDVIAESNDGGVQRGNKRKRRHGRGNSMPQPLKFRFCVAEGDVAGYDIS